MDKIFHIRLLFVRTSSGSIIAEYIPILFVLFFLLFFPFLNLATSLLRYSVLVAAAHEAANAASHATFFLNNTSGDHSKTTAAQISNDTALNFISSLNGNTPHAIVVGSGGIQTRIIQIESRAPFTKVVYPYGQRLNAPADTNSFVYCIEVRITANINPLIPMTAINFLNVPGLTDSYIATVTAREYAENPQGLNQ